ncbi:MAG: Rnf-Nqr domain containing protein [Oscillospiraceae bacterium]
MEPSKKEKSQAWVDFRASLPGKLKALPGKIGGALKGHFVLSKSDAAELRMRSFGKERRLLGLLFLCCAVLPVSVGLRFATLFGLTAGVILLLEALILPPLLPHLPEKLRAICGAAISAGLVVLACQVLVIFLAQEATAPLMLLAAAPFVYEKSKEKQGDDTPRNGGYVLLETFLAWAGFALALVLFAAMRELLGAGSLWNVKILPQFSALLIQPAGGFLLASGILCLLHYLMDKSGKRGQGT